MSDRTYKAINRTLFWWQYQPADERELSLYRTAFERFFWSILGCVIISLIALELMLTDTIPAFVLKGVEEPLRFIEMWIITVLLLSYAVASTTFNGHELTLKKQHNAVTRLMPIILIVTALILGVGWWIEHR